MGRVASPCLRSKRHVRYYLDDLTSALSAPTVDPIVHIAFISVEETHFLFDGRRGDKEWAFKRLQSALKPGARPARPRPVSYRSFRMRSLHCRGGFASGLRKWTRRSVELAEVGEALYQS